MWDKLLNCTKFVSVQEKKGDSGQSKAPWLDQTPKLP